MSIPSASSFFSIGDSSSASGQAYGKHSPPKVHPSGGHIYGKHSLHNLALDDAVVLLQYRFTSHGGSIGDKRTLTSETQTRQGLVCTSYSP